MNFDKMSHEELLAYLNDLNCTYDELIIYAHNVVKEYNELEKRHDLLVKYIADLEKYMPNGVLPHAYSIQLALDRSTDGGILEMVEYHPRIDEKVFFVFINSDMIVRTTDKDEAEICYKENLYAA